MNKQQDFKQFFLLLGVLVGLNLLVGFYYFRIDLTEDQRFSLGEPTKKLLDNLEEEMFVTVYLSGDFPAKFEKIEQAIQDKLSEMRQHAGSDFNYYFEDPTTGSNDSLQKITIQKLQKKGLNPMRIFENENGQKVEKIIFPGALIEYKGREVVVDLVKGNTSTDADQRIAQSIGLLEYELAKSIKLIVQAERKRIAFIDGHGEPTDPYFQDLFQEISRFSEVGRLNLNTLKDLREIKNLDLLVMVKPSTPYSEEDKFKIDQFLMNGGNLAFFIDPIDLRPDTTNQERIIGVPRDLNLKDMLFTYGARINADMVQDLQGARRPFQVDQNKNYEFYPFDFFPIINTFSKHPSVKNSGPVLMKNVSTIDTVRADGITKIPLMFTSQYTRVTGGNVFFEADQIKMQKDQSYYTQKNIPVAYLLEGEFTSNFVFKPVPKNLKSTKKLNKALKPAKVFICADGDVLINSVNPKNGQTAPLGAYPMTGEQFSNKETFTNIMDYVLDNAGINSLRTKDIKKRPLDKLKIQEGQKFWQIINVVFPLVLLLVFGLAMYFIRKKRYTGFPTQNDQDNR